MYATGTLTNLHLRNAEGKFFALLCDPSDVARRASGSQVQELE